MSLHLCAIYLIVPLSQNSPTTTLIPSMVVAMAPEGSKDLDEVMMVGM